MALLRPCGRLVQAFVKLSINWQFEYVPNLERVTRIQGYVTVAPKPGATISKTDKFEFQTTKTASNDDIPLPNFTNDVQRKLIALCVGVKNDRIQETDLLRILESHAGGREKINESTLLDLLNCCGDRLQYVETIERRNLTNQVWDLIRRDPSKLTVRHYNALLLVHDQNDQAIQAQKFIDDMVVKPDVATYKILLNSVAQRGDVRSALYLVSRLRDEGGSMDLEMFNSVVLAHVMNGDVESALAVLETMKQSGIEPVAQTYANLARGYARLGDFVGAMKIVEAHDFDAAQLMRIVDGLSSAGLGDRAIEVLKRIEPPVAARTFADALSRMTADGRAEDAFRVIDWLANYLTPDEMETIYGTFLNDMVRAKISNSTIMKMLNVMNESNYYPLAITDVCQSALRYGERELAMAVLETMHEQKIAVRPHYYWPLLIRASKDYGENDVYRTIRHMLCLNVRLDFDTLFQYVLPRVNTAEPLVTLRKLCDLGLETSVVCTPLVCYLMNQRRIKEATSLCARTRSVVDFDRIFRSLVSAYRTTKYVDDCAKILKFAPTGKYYAEQFLLTLVGKAPRGRKVSLLKEYLRAFENHGIGVTNVNLEKCESSNLPEEYTLRDPGECVTTFKGIPHPRDMSVEELECHLIELKSKRMNVRGLLRKLLQAHCRRNNLARAEELRREYDANNFAWTAGMHSSLMELYVRHGMIDRAMDLYSKIQNCKDFKLDDFKVMKLGIALVQSGRIAEACTLLGSTGSTGGVRLIKDCWRLLDVVAHSDDYKLTESMFDVIVGSGYCEVNNILLGPLVRAHLVRNDLAKAVDTFARCAERWGHTPLRQEVVSAIVEATKTGDEETKEEMAKLMEIVKSRTIKIHGKQSLAMDLLVALAQFGRIDELREFLQNNRISTNALTRNLALVTESKKIPILTTLLLASKEINGINRCSIYEELLSLYSRSSNCDKAVELWNKMLADDLKPTKKFRSSFVGLLKNHKVPLPENFTITDEKLFEPKFDK